MVKRILYCEGNIDGTVGGSYYSLYFLTSNLPRKDYEPIVIFHGNHSLLPEFCKKGIDARIWPLPSSFVLSGRYSKVLRPLQRGINFNRFLLSRAVKYFRFLRRERIDLVHLNNSVTQNHAWMLGAILAGIPCITHQRGINDHYSSMDHRLGESLAAVICISEAVRCNLIDHGFDSDRLSIIYNGLDPESLSIKRSPSTLRRQLQIDADQPVIGIVGNIKEWKGQMVVARAVKRLLDRYQGLVCLFVGDTAAADSCYEKKLKTFISENRMQDNIFFTGYQNNVADWINLMDVMIHASVKPEPFGRVFLEAMAMKKPVIGSAAGAVPEIIEHGVTGLLYPPGDDDKLAEAILSLLENSQLGRDMSEAGYKRLQKLFHVRKNVLLTTELYQKLLV